MLITEGAQLTREVLMKKLFIIIGLASLQLACTTQPPQPAPQGALLSFNDLAGEITVNRETTPAMPISSRTTERDEGDSS
jgi:hypothetical protein